MRMYTTIRTDTIESKIASYELYGKHEAAEAMRDLGVPVREWKIALEVYRLALSALKFGYTIADATMLRYKQTAIDMLAKQVKLKRIPGGYSAKQIENVSELMRYSVVKTDASWCVYRGRDKHERIAIATRLKDARYYIAEAIVG